MDSFNLDDKDLAIGGMIIIAVVSVVAGLILKSVPWEVVGIAIAGMGSIATGRKKE